MIKALQAFLTTLIQRIQFIAKDKLPKAIAVKTFARYHLKTLTPLSALNLIFMRICLVV